jgi:hypothetical protein
VCRPCARTLRLVVDPFAPGERPPDWLDDINREVPRS